VPVPPLRIAVAGLGAIGMAVARALAEGVPGCVLAAASARDLDAARARLGFAPEVPLVPLADLAGHADLVVECAPGALLADVVTPFLAAGRTAVVLSCGALLAHPELIDLARERGGRILVPSGALPGLDAVRAAAEGTIHSVTLATRKPVAGLQGAPYLAERGIDLAGLAEPLRVFAGSAREAALAFPANVNVAAALALAGIGPERTRVEVWADPAAARNRHTVAVASDSANFTLDIENLPSENPRTSRITALSAIALLRGLAAPLRVGS